MHFTNFFMFASFWTGRRRSIFEIGLFAVRPICCVLPSEGFKYVFEFAFCCVARCGETEIEPLVFGCISLVGLDSIVLNSHLCACYCVCVVASGPGWRSSGNFAAVLCPVVLFVCFVA